MEKLYIALMIGAIIASIFAAGVLIWAFVNVRKTNNEPESIQIVIGIGALVVSALAIFEIIFFYLGGDFMTYELCIFVAMIQMGISLFMFAVFMWAAFKLLDKHMSVSVACCTGALVILAAVVAELCIIMGVVLI